jgi:phospholipid/cholesterol/gamma-HCH transport system substrate-binding protein
MRRWLIAAVLAAALVAVAVLLSGGGGNDGYVVRAIFDNAGFMVQGEEVRVGGATVGKIESVDVTMPGEVDSYKDGEPQAIPGKAVIVMRIDDPGFQDFRSDATCYIRPQSLIGEKFVDCRPTLPRAPGSKPPPPLREVPAGQPGAGQLLLPVENNSTSVDPDLINNIQRLPYAQRFRLIFNELGASLAGRGEDLEEVVKRANPVLRDVDRLFGILSSQRRQLAQLTADSERILRPFARQRASVAGFFSNAGAAAQASSERGADLEASLRKLPAFLRELRQTMRTLEGFSDAATPVFADLGKATPSFTRATRALTPFSAASTVSLKSLGAAGEVAGPKLRATDPVVRKIRNLSRSGARPNTNLAKLLVSTEQTGGFDNLVGLIYNTAAVTNEFDRYGHFGRNIASLVDCLEYSSAPAGKTGGCASRFNGPNVAATASVSGAAELYRRLQEELGGETGGTSSDLGPVEPQAVPPAPATPVPEPEAPGVGEGESLEGGEGPPAAASSAPYRRALLDYLLGP